MSFYSISNELLSHVAGKYRPVVCPIQHSHLQYYVYNSVEKCRYFSNFYDLLYILSQVDFIDILFGIPCIFESV